MRFRLESNYRCISENHARWRSADIHLVQQITITRIGAERVKIRLRVYACKARIPFGLTDPAVAKWLIDEYGLETVTTQRTTPGGLFAETGARG
jgi:hypothetical protein